MTSTEANESQEPSRGLLAGGHPLPSLRPHKNRNCISRNAVMDEHPRPVSPKTRGTPPNHASLGRLFSEVRFSPSPTIAFGPSWSPLGTASTSGIYLSAGRAKCPYDNKSMDQIDLFELAEQNRTSVKGRFDSLVATSEHQDQLIAFARHVDEFGRIGI